MGLLETLTVIFIVLKLCGVIDWSWWLVWAPMYPALALYAFMLFGLFFTGSRVSRRR